MHRERKEITLHLAKVSRELEWRYGSLLKPSEPELSKMEFKSLISHCLFLWGTVVDSLHEF
jgi:hypothetical protein